MKTGQVDRRALASSQQFKFPGLFRISEEGSLIPLLMYHGNDKDKPFASDHGNVFSASLPAANMYEKITPLSMFTVLPANTIFVQLSRSANLNAKLKVGVLSMQLFQ